MRRLMEAWRRWTELRDGPAGRRRAAPRCWTRADRRRRVASSAARCATRCSARPRASSTSSSRATPRRSLAALGERRALRPRALRHRDGPHRRLPVRRRDGARRALRARPARCPSAPGAALEEDLARRDFTVNAIALGPRPTAGCARRPARARTCERRLLRVLHDGSFVDDPTRLLRLVRYARPAGLRPSSRDRARWPSRRSRATRSPRHRRPRSATSCGSRSPSPTRSQRWRAPRSLGSRRGCDVDPRGGGSERSRCSRAARRSRAHRAGDRRARAPDLGLHGGLAAHPGRRRGGRCGRVRPRRRASASVADRRSHRDRPRRSRRPRTPEARRWLAQCATPARDHGRRPDRRRGPERPGARRAPGERVRARCSTARVGDGRAAELARARD